MLEEAVEVGFAAFCEGDAPASDQEVADRLLAGGVEPWLAWRLVRFLPLAVGRLLLTGAELSDEFVDGDVLRRLDGDPVFRAVAARAARVSRLEVERVGLHSAEVGAANQLLHRGGQLEDLQFAPPAFPDPLPPVQPGDGGVPSPAAAFAALLAGHGFGPGHEQAGDLRFDARVFPHPRPTPAMVMAQVDFRVGHPALAAPWLVESFAGTGATWRAAILQAVEKFSTASLHVLVAGLLDRQAAAGQVSWERMEHPGGAFELCAGPQLTIFAATPAVAADELLDRLLDALRRVPLTRQVHWLRLFTMYRDGQLDTNEVLLDGAPWQAGEAVVAGLVPTGTATVGTRIFAMLVPAP